jgi:hypothetical protein
LTTERAIAIENSVAAEYTAYYGHCTAHQMVFRPNIINEHPDWSCVGVSYARRRVAAHHFPKVWYSWNELFEGIPGVEEHETLRPITTMLKVNPNPFTHETRIRYIIQDPGYTITDMVLKIFDATGRLVKSFRPTPNALRSTQISWDGTDQANRQLPSGVYFVKFQAGDYTETKKLLLIK